MPPELCVVCDDIGSEIRAQLPKLCAKKPQKLFDEITKFPGMLYEAGSPQRAFLEKAGVSFGPDLIQVDVVKEELQPPPIEIIGLKSLEGAVHAQNYCNPFGFGSETGRMKWPASQFRVRYFVRVTYEWRDRDFAKGWVDKIERQLNKANAPVQFFQPGARPKATGLFEPHLVANSRGHAAVVHAPHREATTEWARVPSLLISFLHSPDEVGDPDYNDIARNCMQAGVQRQCINVQKSRANKNANAIQANLTKQIINKDGSLVWGPKCDVLSENCPALAGKLLMMVGIASSHTLDIFTTAAPKVSTTSLVAVFLNMRDGQIQTCWDFVRTVGGHGQVLDAGNGNIPLYNTTAS